MSDSVRPHGWQPTRLPHPWDSPGKNTGVGCHFLLQCMKVKSESEVAQSCPTLSDPMDCSLPDSSVHGIFQARVLEWGAIAFSIDNTGVSKSPQVQAWNRSGCINPVPSVPYTLGWDWEKLRQQELKQKKLTSLCNLIWPQYELGYLNGVRCSNFVS